MVRLFGFFFAAVSGVSVATQNATAKYLRKAQKHSSAHISTKSIIQAGAGMAVAAVAVDNMAYSLSKQSDSSSSSPGNGDCPNVPVRQAFDWANTNNGIFFCNQNPNLKNGTKFVTSNTGTDFNGTAKDEASGLYNVVRLPLSNPSEVTVPGRLDNDNFGDCVDDNDNPVPCATNCTLKPTDQFFSYVESKPESLMQLITPGVLEFAFSIINITTTTPAGNLTTTTTTTTTPSSATSQLTGTYALSHKFSNLLNIDANNQRFSSVTCVPLNVQQINFGSSDYRNGLLNTASLFDHVRDRLTFIFLKNLEYINLEINSLTKVVNFAFYGCGKLERIIISSQEEEFREYILTELEPYALFGVPSLKRLEVNNNALSTLPEQLFRDTPLFEDLQAFSNRFTHFPLELFANLPHLTDIRLEEQCTNINKDPSFCKTFPNGTIDTTKTLKEFPPFHNQIDLPAANNFSTNPERAGIECIDRAVQKKLLHALQGRDPVTNPVEWRQLDLCSNPFTKSAPNGTIPVDPGDCSTQNKSTITQYLINIANDENLLPIC